MKTLGSAEALRVSEDAAARLSVDFLLGLTGKVNLSLALHFAEASAAYRAQRKAL